MLPSSSEFLVEVLESKEGFHVFMFPFAGRLVHEGMASLVAYRIGREHPRSFSMAFNDYGFELLTDRSFPIDEADVQRWLSTEALISDLQSAVNAAEIARRKFRDIAVIAGLVFRGYPGAPVKDRHLQMSSSLVFEVFGDYDSQNLLYRQAFDEMLEYQLEIRRFRQALLNIDSRRICISRPEKPTPLGFPIMVDRLRERMSMEQLEDRIARMQREV
jgi:ATP-dependent Lhr-like helicase